MEDIDINKLQYPIGHFIYPNQVTQGIVSKWIRILEELPVTLENLVKHLSDEQLETPYRPGGGRLGNWYITLQIVIIIAIHVLSGH